MRSRIHMVGGVATAGLALVLAGCGGGGDSSQQTQASGQTTHIAGGECTPAVMVVRHAEDEDNPAGGADILSAAGVAHAKLYPKLFEEYLAEPHSIGPDGADVSVCQIGKIISINDKSNSENRSPGTNPFQTILPLGQALDLPTPPEQGKDGILVEDPSEVSYSTVYNWDSAARLQTLLDNGSSTPTSTVIAWDKQGLNPSAENLSDDTITSDKYPNGAPLRKYGYTPLLQALPVKRTEIVGSAGYYDPLRTDFYVFTLQDPNTGKFAVAKAYRQLFSNDGTTWSPNPTAKSRYIKVVKR